MSEPETDEPFEPELFHSIPQPESGRVRKRMVELGVEERIAMRNVTYDSPREDLASHGGAAPPAIWDGERLHQGEAACLAFLEQLRGG